MQVTAARRGLPRLGWLLAGLLAFGGGAAYASAQASHSQFVHYHCYVVCHGLVHGSDPNDGDFHARTEAGGNTDVRYCAAIEAIFGPSEVRLGSKTVYGLTGTCNYWVDPARGRHESGAFAESYADAGGQRVLQLHGHPLER